MGIGFEKIIAYGKFTRQVTGLGRLIGGNQARYLGVPNGLIVFDVKKGSAAEYAGIRPVVPVGAGLGLNFNTLLSGSIGLADVILSVNGHAVNTEADFLKALDMQQPGDIIDMCLLRSVTLPMGRKNSSDSGEKKELRLRVKLQ